AWRSSGVRCARGAPVCVERARRRRSFGESSSAGSADGASAPPSDSGASASGSASASASGSCAAASSAGASSAAACASGAWASAGCSCASSGVSGVSFSCSSAMSSVSSQPSMSQLLAPVRSLSRATVSARARSRLARPTPAVFSSSPVALAKRRPNTSLRRTAICLASSPGSMSRISLAVIASSVLAQDELGLHRELVCRQPDRVARKRLGHAGKLEHHAAGLDHRHPAFGRALAGAHARLGRLLRDRLVREHVDPHLAATLDLAGHRNTCRLDLAIGQPTALERLQPVLAELHLDLSARGRCAAPAVLLAVLDALGREHQRPPPAGRDPPRPPPGPRPPPPPPRPPKPPLPGPRPPPPGPPGPRPRPPPPPRPRPRPSRPSRPPRPSRSVLDGAGAVMSVRSAPV